MSEQNSTTADAKLWDLPPVESAQSKGAKALKRTTAFNKPFTQWKYEAPEVEEEIKPLTAEDIEAIRSAAFEEGFESGKQEGFEKGQEEGLELGKKEGFEQGQSEGFEAGKAQADEAAKVQIDALASIVAQLQQPLKQVNDEVKQELVMLTKALASAVLKVELSQSSDSLMQIISESITALPIQEAQYQIMLHPEDVLLINERLASDEANEKNNWRLVPCEEQGRGGCKVLSQNNAVDMSIAKRCEAIFDQMLQEQGLSDDPRAS
ncbi:flagellar assembly protein FliH [Ningiella sp. W23]|uniref:flagellar assembly protein FliH n=1 Tax=Ningiella sp. W23 TaxID=3023715 RepID=UPI003757549E